MSVRVGMLKHTNTADDIVFEDLSEVCTIDTNSECIRTWEDKVLCPFESKDVTWLSEENTAKFIKAMESVLIELLEEEEKV